MFHCHAFTARFLRRLEHTPMCYLDRSKMAQQSRIQSIWLEFTSTSNVCLRGVLIRPQILTLPAKGSADKPNLRVATRLSGSVPRLCINRTLCESQSVMYVTPKENPPDVIVTRKHASYSVTRNYHRRKIVVGNLHIPICKRISMFAHREFGGKGWICTTVLLDPTNRCSLTQLS